MSEGDKHGHIEYCKLGSLWNKPASRKQPITIQSSHADKVVGNDSSVEGAPDMEEKCHEDKKSCNYNGNGSRDN
jgi:hypothetical protein